MTTDIKTLTTSEAAARVGITGQYMRFLLSKGKGPNGTREGKGGRGGGWRFESSAVDAWDAARVKRAAKGSKKGLTQAQHDAATAIDPDKQTRLEAAGWKVGNAEDFLGGEHPLRRLARESMDPLGAEISGEDVDLLGVEISGSGADAFKSLISAVCCAPEFAGMADDHDGE